MPDSTTEIWKPVVGYEGYYEVSSAGRVRSVDRFIRNSRGSRVFLPGKVISPFLLSGRYLAVGLCRDSVLRKKSIHRLVLEAFSGAPHPGDEACHNNGVSTDNRVENLRWDTRSRNTTDQVSHGTHNHARKTHCKRGHEFTPENTYEQPSKPNTRCCKICKKMTYDRWVARRAAVSPDA